MYYGVAVVSVLSTARWSYLYFLAVVGSHFWFGRLISGLCRIVWPSLALTSGFDVFSDQVMSFAWPFSAGSLFLHVNPYLYNWVWMCGASAQRLDHLLASVVTEIIRLAWPFSGITFGFSVVSVSVMHLAWPFLSYSLFLRVIPALSDFSCLCGDVV